MRSHVLVILIGLAVAGSAVNSSVAQEPKLEELVGRLQNSDYVVRLKTLSYIGSMKPYPKEIAPHVIRSLKDSNYNTRAAAANALGNLKNALPDLGTQFPECIPQLIRMLSDGDPEDKHQQVRRYAAYALRHLGPSSKAAVPELLKIAVNKNDIASVRTEAVQALGDIGDDSPEVVAALTKLLDDPARINENYPTVGGTANSALGRFKANAMAMQVYIQRLKVPDPVQRAAAATQLGTTGFGSLDAEKALLELLEDKSAAVQKAALASLEGINGTHAFFFKHNVTSREVDKKQQALLEEIRNDAARKASFVKVLAAQVRLGDGHHPRRADALQRLVALDAREHAPMLKEQFAKLEKKVVYLERRDLRMQLLRVLAAWLSANEAVPFLIAADMDAQEAPQVRFRALVLLCERGDAPSVAHITKHHAAQAKKIKSFFTLEAIQDSLQDRRLFRSDQEFNGRKAVAPDELASIRDGIRLAQYLHGLRQGEAMRNLSFAKFQFRDGKTESIVFRVSTVSEEWSFDLRKYGDLWLPSRFEMTAIR